MATDERSRHEMYLKLEEVFGREVADTVIDHLPPTGWADVARKSDLEQFAVRLELKMEAMESQIEAKVAERLHAQFVTTLTIMSSLFVVLAGLAFAAARLA
jgi:hypothetical protein